MNIFVKYIVNMILSLLKRAWYHAKMKTLKKELEQEKSESNDAIKMADDAINDFDRALRMLRESDKEK